MTQLCGRCGTKLYEKGHYLCDECYPELGTYGDTVTERFWRALSELATVQRLVPREHIKEMADSAPFTKLMIEAILEKDLDTTKRMLKKALEEL